MVLADILDPILSPILRIDPLLAIIIMSFLFSLIITVVYKYTTNQDLMKQLKSEMKELQKEMKELRDKPEDMMRVQRKAMQTNMKYMTQSFKSTLYTIIPVILIFSWMNANFAYEPIRPDQTFQVDLAFKEGATGDVFAVVPEGVEIVDGDKQKITESRAEFSFKGKEGVYIEGSSLKFSYNDTVAFKEIIITDGPEYAPKDKSIRNSDMRSISIEYEKKIILPFINWGWLGAYIIFSIVFSILLRKLMKVY